MIGYLIAHRCRPGPTKFWAVGRNGITFWGSRDGAVRFLRHEDAEAVSRTLPDNLWPFLTVEKHVW